ncbi:hypothetical protein P4574_29680 [Priestia megaterium]|nr:hypothetical protein [Priestia megaterium]
MPNYVIISLIATLAIIIAFQGISKMNKKSRKRLYCEESRKNSRVYKEK